MLGIPYIEGIVGNKKAKKIKGVTFEWLSRNYTWLQMNQGS